jgi:hypothetical protein
MTFSASLCDSNVEGVGAGPEISAVSEFTATDGCNVDKPKTFDGSTTGLDDGGPEPELDPLELEPKPELEDLPEPGPPDTDADPDLDSEPDPKLAALEGNFRKPVSPSSPSPSSLLWLSENAMLDFNLFSELEVLEDESAYSPSSLSRFLSLPFDWGLLL